MISGPDHQTDSRVTSESAEPPPTVAGEASWRTALNQTWWRQRLPVVVTVLLYVAVLHLVYRQMIAPLYGYSGLGYRAPELWSYTAMVLWTVVVGLLLPSRLKRPSDFLIWMLFCLAGAPSILLCQYNSHLPIAAKIPAGLTVGAAMVMLSLGARVQPRLPETLRTRLISPRSRTIDRLRLRRSSGAVWIGLLVVAIGIQVTLLLTSGITLSWLGVYDEVYTVRSDFSQFYERLPLLGYLVPMTTNVINPVLMARGLVTRRYSWFLVGAIGQYTLYATTGTKMTLFSIPALMGLALLLRVRKVLPGYALLLAVVGSIAGAVSADRLMSTQVWVDLIVRRFLVVPGALTAGYIEVFRGQPKTFFADSPLRWLSSPYRDVTPPFLVGAQFTGDPTTNANVSLFGHGYLALGYAGILIEAAALLPILWMLDRAGRGLPFKVMALVLLMPAISLSSATVFTTALTHGLLATVLLFALLPRTGWTALPRSRRRRSGRPDTTQNPADELPGKRIGSYASARLRKLRFSRIQSRPR